jgi:hypothetical protein
VVLDTCGVQVRARAAKKAINGMHEYKSACSAARTQAASHRRGSPFTGNRTALADLHVKPPAQKNKMAIEATEMGRNDKMQSISWESLLLPIVLMITGFVLLGAARFGTISLDRVENFWPMAIILVGLVELIPSEDTEQRASNE